MARSAGLAQANAIPIFGNLSNYSLPRRYIQVPPSNVTSSGHHLSAFLFSIKSGNMLVLSAVYGTFSKRTLVLEDRFRKLLERTIGFLRHLAARKRRGKKKPNNLLSVIREDIESVYRKGVGLTIDQCRAGKRFQVYCIPSLAESGLSTLFLILNSSGAP